MLKSYDGNIKQYKEQSNHSRNNRIGKLSLFWLLGKHYETK